MEKGQVTKQIHTFKSEKALTDKWENSKVISLNQAKKLLEAFKVMNIKDGKECLIFEDGMFHAFREVGKQHDFHMLKTE